MKQKMAEESSEAQSTRYCTWRSFNSPTLGTEMFFLLFNTADALLLPSIRLLIQSTTYQEVSDTHDVMCNSTNTTSKQAAQLASTYFIADSVLRNVPSLLLAFCCGAWSDGVGRTLPSIVSITGIILSIVVYMASIVLVDTPSTALLLILIASAVQGSFGDSTVVTMATYSYITDQTTTQTRTRILGRLIGLNMFGNVIGSFMAGALMHSTTCTLTFSVALALMVISAGLCFVAMSGCNQHGRVSWPCCRELDNEVVAQGSKVINTQEGSSVTGQGDSDLATYKEKSKVSQDIKNASVSQEGKLSSHTQLFKCKNIIDSILVFTQPRPGSQRLHIIIFSIVVLAHRMCRSGEIDCILLFVVLQPLSWARRMYGYFLAADYGMLGVCVIFMLPVILQCGHHPSDFSLLLTGMVFRVVRMFMIMFSTTTWHMLLSIIVGSPSIFIVVSCKSLLSKAVGTEDTGKMFSLISSGETVFSCVGTVVFVSIYGATVAIYSSFVFAIIASVYVILMGLTCYAKCKLSCDDRLPTLSTDSLSQPISLQQEYGTLKPGSR